MFLILFLFSFEQTYVAGLPREGVFKIGTTTQPFHKRIEGAGETITVIFFKIMKRQRKRTMKNSTWLLAIAAC